MDVHTPAPVLSIPFSELKKASQAREHTDDDEDSGRSACRRWAIAVPVFLALLAVVLALSISLPVILKRHHRRQSVSLEPSSVCRSTRYPDVCLASLARSREHDKYGPRDMLEDATRAALRGVEDMLNVTLKYGEKEGHGIKVKAAFRDCVELLSSSVGELQTSLDEITQDDNYESRISDIQTWVSAALTYEDTCMDEMDESSRGEDEKDRKELVKLKKLGQHAQMLLSNALALVNPLVEAWRVSTGSRHWFNDRKFLKGHHIPKVHAIVAQDGSGHFSRIQDALDSAPRMSQQPYVIHIRAGVYHEYITVKVYHPNIVFLGDGQGRTIITGSRSAMEPGITTRTSATVAVEGRGFMARDLTIENTAGPQAGQAVALRVGADRAALWRCTISGYQDTLLAHVFRQFYRECTISGTVDFVFGNAAAVFQNCIFESKEPLHGQETVVTAQGRTDPAQTTGFAFHLCTVQGSWPVYLGRPWKEYARVVWLRTNMASVVQPSGWLTWVGTPFGIRTSYFAEYLSWGPGSGLKFRVPWSKIITKSHVARRYTPGNFIAAGSWLPRMSIVFDDKL